MVVSNMQTTKGNPAPNQFIISDGLTSYFQSYQSIIVKETIENGKRAVYLDEKYWNYSKTTARYRNIFLDETTKQIKEKIKTGIYKLTNLNESED